MTIYGIEGGIGSGKTITGVWHLIKDLYDGRRVFSNVKLKNIPSRLRKNITYLTKEYIRDIFEKVKKKEFDLRNSTIFIQEAHNYVDSRNSQTKDNKVFSYFILQSRHTGEGRCDIIYDTQEFTQVDKRLRRNTDHRWQPFIIEWEIVGKKKLPSKVLVRGNAKIGQRWISYNKIIDVIKTRDMYDTHELVDFFV